MPIDKTYYRVKVIVYKMEDIDGVEAANIEMVNELPIRTLATEEEANGYAEFIYNYMDSEELDPPK
jgi:hypothetical protein